MGWLSNLIGGGTDRTFANGHKVGFLYESRDRARPYLEQSQFVAPDRIDERPRMTKVEDQGSKPWCAAYAATQLAENVLWRKSGYPKDIDPSMIYIRAKELDGMPRVDGTTLEAALQALIDTKVFDGSICSVKSVPRTREAVKFALHKFGVVLMGFSITEEWYKLNPKKTAVCSKLILPGLGGHAICCCGYDYNGVYICNSWGPGWGDCGYGLITWDKMDEQLMSAAVIDRCLDGIVVRPS